MGRRVVAVWSLLAALVVLVVVIEYIDARAPRRGRGGDADARLLLPVPVDRLGALEVADAGTLHRFERDAAGVWFYHGVHGRAEGAHTHAVDPVAAPRIEAALAGFGRTRIERQLARPKDLQVYGLATPRTVILVYRPGEAQPLVQYAVGDVAPDTVSRYVEVVGSPDVVTIPSYQIENLLTLIGALGAPAPAR